MKNLAGNLAVLFFAGIILISETLFFHATKYILDYAVALTVISSAVAGIGLGAYLASRLNQPDGRWFGACCAGTTACLYTAAFVLLRQPNLFALLLAISSIFVCPSVYLANAFARRKATSVYLFDMVGAGTAVLLIVLAFRWVGTEVIFLVLVTLLPFVGALGAVITLENRLWKRVVACAVMFLLSASGAGLLYSQVTHDTLNIAKLVNSEAPQIPRQSALRSPSRISATKSYDSLVGRIDVEPTEDRTFVVYDGFYNDNFTNRPARDYLKYAKPHKIRFPVTDRRVVYGVVPEPRVFVIGSAADGIVKPLKEITPPDRIDSVEINSGILQMMQHDYYDASGQAYKGLRPLQGNALSVLRRSLKKYDMITLVNAHSSRWVGAFGPPDFLHTRESYDLYFDRLTENGYLLFEERPDTRRGELGVKRMILTLYDCLKRRGVKDPSQHFFIWEFMSRRYLAQGLQGIATGSDMYYVGMAVFREPIEGKRRQDLLDWCELRWRVRWDENQGPVFVPQDRLLYPAYLKSKWHGDRFGPFFDMIEANNFSNFDHDFDATIVTNDRPFPGCSTRSIPEVARLIFFTASINIALCAFFCIGAMRSVNQKKRLCMLLAYNIAIGFAFFFVEILLIQAYQNVFLSPSASLAVVLGTILIGSGIGGLLSKCVRPVFAVVALVPSLFVGLKTPVWVIEHDWSPNTVVVLAVISVLIVGLNMGIFFPAGLTLARKRSLDKTIPHLFAVNAVSGAMATVIALFSGIRFGYTWTIVLAFALYLVAVGAYRIAAKGGAE